MDAVKKVDYDVMNLDEAAAFESSFQAFRCVVFPEAITSRRLVVIFSVVVVVVVVVDVAVDC